VTVEEGDEDLRNINIPETEGHVKLKDRKLRIHISTHR